MTINIISKSIKHLFRYFQQYLQILTPLIIYSIFIPILYDDYEAWWIDNKTITLFDVLLTFIELYLYTDIIIKVHKLNLLGEKEFFKYSFHPHIKYIIYGIGLFILSLLPLTIVYILVGVGTDHRLLIGLLSVILVVFYIYILPYVIILPIVATENRIGFIEFTKYLNGFRVTILLQILFEFLLIFIILVLLIYPIIILPELVVILLNTLTGSLLLILFINLLSETARYWNKKYKLYNFEKRYLKEPYEDYYRK